MIPICITIIIIVALICYTIYKCHTYQANKELLDSINIKLHWLKEDTISNDNTLDTVLDKITELNVATPTLKQILCSLHELKNYFYGYKLLSSTKAKS